MTRIINYNSKLKQDKFLGYFQGHGVGILTWALHIPIPRNWTHPVLSPDFH